MRKNKRFIFILLISILLIPLNIFSQNEYKLSKDELFDIYYEKLKELALPRINLEEINKSEFKIKYKHNDYFNKEIAEVTCANIKFDMEIDPITGKIMGCYNGIVGEDKTLYEGGAKPTKNREEILRQAEKYLIIINGEIPKNSFLYIVEYGVRGWYDSKHSYDGKWFIGWGRQEGEYKYLWDAITVSINEKYGLYSYGYNFFSQYHPPNQINISKEKAIEIAKGHIDSIVRSPLVGGWYDGYKIGDVYSAELMIVNPNYVHKFRKNYNPTPQPYARLAWVIAFTSLDKSTNKKGILANSMIWIDAETGEPLGGG